MALTLSLSTVASPTSLLCLAFNQDNSCIVVSNTSGVRIYSLDTHQQCFELEVGAISIARMLFCTSLLAFVGAGEQPTLTPRKLTLLNTHNNEVIQTLSFPSSVLNVLINRKRLCVLLEKRSYVYDLESLQLQKALDVPPNPKGIGALTSCSEPSWLALPSPDSIGAVRVYDVLAEGGPLCEIAAHRAALSLAAWSEDGSLLATASARGTVVRVHRVPAGPCAWSFRRGASPATITGLAFSPPLAGVGGGGAVRLLCAASDHGTVHLYSLQQDGKHRHPAAAAARSLLASIVPGKVRSAAEPARCLATVRLPGGSGTPAICAVVPEPDAEAAAHDESAGPRPGDEAGDGAAPALTLAVATSAGVLYSYRVHRPASAAPRSHLEGEWSLAGPAAR